MEVKYCPGQEGLKKKEEMSMSQEKEAAPAEKRGRGRRRIFIVTALALALVGASLAYFTGFLGAPSGQKAAVSQEEKAKYTCGMHPWIIQEKPGSCPVCGMTLTKVEEKSLPPASAKPQAEEFFAKGDAKNGE